ncbi:MAG: tRNA glutamyl-Q(34) synthetase GluQRS [Rubrimonas sp.]
MTVTERFAPSPTGLLHLGHAFSALTAHDAARAAGGRFLLRIEDIDRARCRPAFETAAIDDLGWLGLTWDAPPMRQSERGAAYAAALDRLRAMGLLYPCACTRADMAAALSAPQEGAEGQVYPGTCRNRTGPTDPGKPVALRLHLGRALAAAGPDLWFREIGAGPNGQTGRIALDPEMMQARIGDVALGRKDIGVSYHLCVVVDDAAQGITHVTRGADLFEAAALHRLLQALLNLPVPVWRHHRLIRDEGGRRLAKRDDARSIASLRAAGATPEDIRKMVGLRPAPRDA